MTRTHLPTLRFSPYAWAKLLAFRDYGSTEIAGFGIAASDDPLLIEDFITVRQRCSSVTVAMDDQAVADFFDKQVDQGRKPEQFLRVWLHTHPGTSAQPSGVDEETFERVFGKCDWAVMAILARGGQTYARLRFGVGPGGQMLIPVEVDFSVPFRGAEHDAWKEEYNLHVTAEPEFSVMHKIAATLLTAGGDEEGLAERHHRRLHRWNAEDSWDGHELSDAEALAMLEAELDERAQREQEVSLDSYGS
ncbi:MAG: hypothetical protein WD768_03895 [Phycisphaeraceae bacterium]